jgi:hypothetical protein
MFRSGPTLDRFPISSELHAQFEEASRKDWDIVPVPVSLVLQGVPGESDFSAYAIPAANFHDVLNDALVVVEFVVVHHNLPSGTPTERVHGFTGRISHVWVIRPGPAAATLNLPVVPAISSDSLHNIVVKSTPAPTPEDIGMCVTKRKAGVVNLDEDPVSELDRHFGEVLEGASPVHGGQIGTAFQPLPAAHRGKKAKGPICNFHRNVTMHSHVWQLYR